MPKTTHRGTARMNRNRRAEQRSARAECPRPYHWPNAVQPYTRPTPSDGASHDKYAHLCATGSRKMPQEFDEVLAKERLRALMFRQAEAI